MRKSRARARASEQEGGGARERGEEEREREREKFIVNQEVTEVGKHNALSGNTASGRTGSSI
jgi:hypothetical protein